MCRLARPYRPGAPQMSNGTPVLFYYSLFHTSNYPFSVSYFFVLRFFPVEGSLSSIGDTPPSWDP